MKGNVAGADANPPLSDPGERLNIYATSSFGLFVLLYEVSVRIYLKLRFFPVRFD